MLSQTSQDEEAKPEDVPYKNHKQTYYLYGCTFKIFVNFFMLNVEDNDLMTPRELCWYNNISIKLCKYILQLCILICEYKFCLLLKNTLKLSVLSPDSFLWV